MSQFSSRYVVRFFPRRFAQPAHLAQAIVLSCGLWACGGGESSGSDGATGGQPPGDGSGGSATGGQNGSATGGQNGSATGGQNGSATGGQNGSATGGQNGSATGGQNGSATGGQNGSATGGQNGGPTREGFTLLFEDNFDTLDTTRWQAATHTFAENACQFDPSMVTIENGHLRLGLQAVQTPTSEGRNYIGGELRTIESFSYGRFEARIRFAPGSGVVSSLFSFYDHYADPNLPENWNEIDIEFLGNNSSRVQFNVIHWNAANQKITHEHLSPTAFDPSAEFHDYAFEWLPTEVRFFIDDQLVHSQTDQIEQFLTLDSRLMMNVWPVQNTPDLIAWAGQFGPESVPTAAYYDWVRVYAYTPGN